MFKPSTPQSATLPNIVGANLPPLDLGISSEFQFCVDAGASAAAAFLGDISNFNLHDHIAVALQSFSASVGAGLAAAGDYAPIKMQACIDAFAAGYLGRIQQELRLFHGEEAGRNLRRAIGLATAGNAMNWEFS